MKLKMIKNINLILILVLFSSMELNASMVKLTKELKCELIQKAIVVIQENYPNSYKELNDHRFVIRERADDWIVSWKPRKGIAEGAPVIFIDKKTLEIIKHYHTQ